MILTSMGNIEKNQATVVNFVSPVFLEIDRCNPNPCQHGAPCEEINGGVGYVCQCPVGYKGQICDCKYIIVISMALKEIKLLFSSINSTLLILQFSSAITDIFAIMSMLFIRASSEIFTLVPFVCPSINMF